MLQDLKKFLLRGNVVDLAVAVIVGVAFTGVVSSLANDVLMQLVGAAIDVPDFKSVSIDVLGTEIYYGLLINAIVNFLIVGVTMFFVVHAISKLSRPKAEEPGPTETELLAEIRDLLREGRAS